LGQGACQALEDAAALANHIQARQIEALISYRV
jgi:2-polyprenyl-6-methoxyphenol hydroxylase-like FAD-dependent oxidoreductase